MQARRPRGVRLIIAYKLAKAVGEAVLAVVLVTLILAGYGAELVHFAEQLRRHVAGAWSVRLADVAVTLATPHRLWELVVALALDAALTLLEGLSLVRGAWWGPWLVVIATSSLIPFEIVALAHHLHAGRLVILAINLVIVGYLVGRAARGRARAKLRE